MINKKVEIFKYLNLLFFLFLIESAHATSNKINQNISNNTFGNPGIIDIPVAGSFEDGRIGFSSSKFGANLRNTLQFQALPRVFAAFCFPLSNQPMLNTQQQGRARAGGGARQERVPLLLCVEPWLITQWQTER